MDTPTTDASLAGKQLFEAYAARKPLRFAASPESLAQGYDIQDAFVAHRAGGAGFAGFKIAWTTPLMQQRVGTDGPGSGRLMAAERYLSPATVAAASYEALAIECEVAVTMGEAVAADATREEIFAAVETLQLAFELVDPRPFDRKSSLAGGVAAGVAESIAANIHGAGVVLGEPRKDWRDLDVASAVCELRIDGELAGTGCGADVLGHPVAPLAWLVPHLAALGQPLAAGDVVITGAMIAPTRIASGQRAVATMDGFAAIELNVQ
jgi:2-keto-4-pentenoate hydratase